MPLSERFDDALVFASRLHARQRRKGTDIPYVAHLLAVTALVLEHGGGEDEAIAALLHDAVEDQGGAATLEAIRARFGAVVADTVAGCSDAHGEPKPPWRARKEAYIAHVRHAPAAVVLVSACDKLHNARSILADYRRIGEALWPRFNAGAEAILWYYQALAVALRGAGAPEGLSDELERTVAEIVRLYRERGG